MLWLDKNEAKTTASKKTSKKRRQWNLRPADFDYSLGSADDGL